MKNFISIIVIMFVMTFCIVQLSYAKGNHNGNSNGSRNGCGDFRGESTRGGTDRGNNKHSPNTSSDKSKMDSTTDESAGINDDCYDNYFRITCDDIHRYFNEKTK